MIQLGKFQDLYIVKKKEFGVYVNDQKDVTEGSILLPAKQVPDGARIGDQISCFVYKDSEVFVLPEKVCKIYAGKQDANRLRKEHRKKEI